MARPEKHIHLTDEVYMLIVKKHAEFLLKGIRKPMQEIANTAILAGIDKIQVEVEVQKVQEIQVDENNNLNNNLNK